MGLLRESGLPNTYKGHEEVIEKLLQITDEFGGNTRENVDLCIARCKVVVAEIYSPPRVTRAARLLSKLGISPGFAMDITTNDENGEPWNFDEDRQKQKAERKVIETEPDLLVGSPMCKDFSPWQRLNKAKSSEPEKYEKNRESSRTHLEFVCRNTRHQYTMKGDYSYTNARSKQARGTKSACGS